VNLGLRQKFRDLGLFVVRETREIHRGGGVSREVVMPIEDPATLERSGRLGRQIATAAFVLVVLNVAIGLGVITWKSSKRADSTRKEAEIRRQLAESLGAAAQKAMPPPSFVSEEVALTASRDIWDEIAAKITDGATAFGGSAAKALPEEGRMTVIVDVPSSREAEFRKALASAATMTPMPSLTPSSSAEASAPNERTIIQIRITEAAR
jgi:hypothetical protein